MVFLQKRPKRVDVECLAARAERVSFRVAKGERDKREEETKSRRINQEQEIKTENLKKWNKERTGWRSENNINKRKKREEKAMG